MLGEISSPSMVTVPVVLYNTPPFPVAVLPAFTSGVGVPPSPPVVVAAVYVPNLPADMVVLPPLFANTPPFVPAVLPVNVPPLTLDVSAPAKYATPPAFVAELPVKVPLDMVIASPEVSAQSAPPYNVAEFPVKVPPDMVRVLDAPEKATAPPLPFVLTVKPSLFMVPAVLPLFVVP